MRSLYLIVIAAMLACWVRAADTSVSFYADWSAGKRYFTDSAGTQLGTSAKAHFVAGDNVQVTINVLSNTLTVGTLATGTYTLAIVGGGDTLLSWPLGTGLANSAVSFPSARLASAALNAFIGETGSYTTFPSYHRGRTVTVTLTDSSGTALVSDTGCELWASREVYDPAVKRTNLDSTDFTHTYSTDGVTIGAVSIAKGGTGATSASGARTALGLGSLAVASTVSASLLATYTADSATPCVPVMLAISVPLTAGATTVTPGIALQIVDAWAVSGSVGTSGDTIRVSTGNGANPITDAIAYSAVAGQTNIYVRPKAWTPTVATVTATQPVTITTTGGGSVAAGVLYLLCYPSP